MRKFMVEGSNDGDMFTDIVEAETLEEATDLAIDMLCDAWGHEREADTDLGDLGDAAVVWEYGEDQYVRDAASDMLAVLRDLLPHVSFEIEQRKDGGNAEDWAELEAIEQRALAVIAAAAPQRVQ